MRGAAVLVVAAACYGPTTQTGSPCDPGPCPAPLVCSPASHTCETRAIDAAIDTPPAPWLAGYAFRKRIDVTPHAATEALADFPLDIAIADPGFASGLAFTAGDGTTQLPAEVVGFDPASGALDAWVAATLAPAATTTLYLYFGGVAAPAASPWSPLFLGVWHMTGANSSADSSSHAHTAAAATAAQTPAAIAGVSGAARGFDGVDDALGVPDPADGSLDVGTRSFSYSVWVDVTQSVGLYDIPFHKGGSSLMQHGYDIELGTGPWNANISDGVTVANATFGMETDLLGRWTQLVVVVDRAAAQLRTYRDGALVTTHDIAGVGSLDTTLPLSFSVATYPFHGGLDEVRIYNAALSASWIATEHENLAAPALLFTVGSTEQQP